MAYERKTCDIFVSDKMKDILTQIQHESVVAHLLLKKRHHIEDLVEDPINYISVSETDPGKISYLTKDRIEKVVESDVWTTSSRFITKPGTFVGKIFKDISSKDVERFSNLYKSISKKAKFNLRVVSGEEIRRFYYYESYQSDRGTLGASCMKHDSSQKLLRIYSDNPEQVKMLVMLDENELLMGRALLWNFDSYKIMDRIYTVCDEDLSPWFKRWATENGYLFKSEQNWYNTLQFERIGDKKQELKLKLTLKNKDHSYYPYMDTFKFVDDEGTIYNYQPAGNFFTLTTTDGGRHSDNHLRFDGIDRVYRYSHETVYLDYLNLYTHQPKCFYSESNDCYILRKDAVMCEESRDYIFGDQWNHLNNVEVIQDRIKRYSDRPSREKERLFEFILSQRQRIMSDFIETNTEEL